MKLSIEARVATAVAVAFGVLSIGAIAREQSEGGSRGHNAYLAINNPGLTEISALDVTSPLSVPHGETEVLGPY
jgi:hypothetical protein